MRVSAVQIRPLPLKERGFLTAFCLSETEIICRASGHWRRADNRASFGDDNAPMSKRVLKLGLFLLAGAIANVAVAWGFTFLLQADSRLVFDLSLSSWLNDVHLRNQIRNSQCMAGSSIGAHLVTVDERSWQWSPGAPKCVQAM